MAKLINGNGNPAIYANQDADLIAALAGNTTGIAKVGSEYSYTQEDANTIGLADGVIVTKEGRRIQLDEGNTDLFSIPTGQLNVTNYYIIGYKLTTDTEGRQICETFVQKMNSSTETITEDTFKGGATEVYVSVYRVTQVGLNISTVTLLLPKLTNIAALNSSLSTTNTNITTINRDVAWYGTSSTAAATAAKVASTNDSKFTLVTGAKVKIKFTYNNTASAPTLNVDSKGAVAIKAYGTTAPSVWWSAGDVVEFTYDGTNFIMGATEGQISELKSYLTDVKKLVSVSSTGNGTYTFAQILNGLLTKLNNANYVKPHFLEYNKGIYACQRDDHGSDIRFTRSYVSGNNAYMAVMALASPSGEYTVTTISSGSVSTQDNASEVVPNGSTITVWFYI